MVLRNGRVDLSDDGLPPDEGSSSPLAGGPNEFIEDQVARTPDAPALTIGTEQISYGELNSRANRLAHFLREQGVGAESLVGVYLDRSLDSVVSLLAILKSGGAYLPLDPKFPKDRLLFMMEDSEVSLLLTHSSKQEVLRETTARVVLLDREGESLAKFPATNFTSNSKPEQLAYLIYTSGSTGKPKGVMIPRRALVNFLLSMLENPGMAGSDIHLAVTTTSFDISILELLLPLMCGAQIVIATAEQAADARELQRLLREHAVTVMQATPTTWRMLIENGWQGKDDLRILCGGEALAPDLARQLVPHCRALWNMYGPTETTIWSSVDRITSPEQISLGVPIANTQFHVLDENQKPVAPGTPGELWIGGTGLARGYLKRPELTAERFVIDPFTKDAKARLYHTGDEVRSRPDGKLEYLRRLDQQVKLNGFRIELAEIESVLATIDGVGQAVVMLREDRAGDKRLVAYYTGRDGLSSSAIVLVLKASLPDYMIPSVFLRMEKFPLTANAKLDRNALPKPEGKRPLLAQAFIAPGTATEKQLANLWCELLQLEEVGMDDSFFDLGGNSLAAVRMVSQYHARFQREISPVKVFQYPTIAKLSQFLDESDNKTAFLAEVQERARHQHTSDNGGARDGVAVIGMVGRFPGAPNLDQLWRNLCGSVESISFFSPEELGPGIEEHLRHDPDYIRARGLIEGADLFDAAFFGIHPLEAKVMDPQQRVFLELAQAALENAGYDPERYKGRIGVYAGIGDNHYYTTNLLTHPELLAAAGKLAVEYGNQKDYIALRTAYLLDLRGPAVSLNTACSTTLLAVDQAYRSLLDYECDIALSGGIDITVPQKSGFLYQEGSTFAKDGHCRPFDADASGTMFCDGAGVVVLKRLADARADGDTIYAVIRGTGKNNNGARPASFLAPSIDGQAEVIALAQSNANVPVETIRYIETHGTGTPVGDPIEFEALRRVFESKTDKKEFCYIGSIKGNVGHPTNAAGVAGLIKAALVLHHQEIPPTLHFKKPNPKIEFAGSPFVMADKLIPFPRGGEVRRTAVSSFGFGGTNVHVILEEAPERKAGSASRPLQLLPLSARSPGALDAYSRALAEHFSSAAPEAFADAAFTFQTGRKQMAHRRFVVATDSSEAAKLLLQPHPLRCSTKRCDRRDPAVVFLFGGQGTQYVNMGLNLYRDEPLFRAIVDQCCESLKPHLGKDLRELLYPRAGDEAAAKISLQDTFYTQPSIFVIEYALARFWQSLGIEPAMMAGHSIGEFVAATLAGVWELEDALSVIALRGRLMQNLPRGSMMTVNNSADAVAKILPAALQIASNNAPNLCVVAGAEENIAGFQKQLEDKDIVCRRLHTSHAFHSAMMDPMIAPLREAVSKIQLRPPARPFVSTVTGRPITAAETTDPGYWASHSRATVEFSKAIQYLKEQGYDLFLECGPRSTLCSLARQQFTPSQPCVALPTFADTPEDNTEWATMLFAMGSLWQNGVSLDWDAFYANEDRRRIPMPTYPFERQRFWVDPAAAAPNLPIASSDAGISPVVEAQDLSAVQPSVSSTTSSSNRKDRIVSSLLDLLVPFSGHDRSQISASATFLEQGFDSLSLTQVAFAIRKEFSAKVSFTQLMNQLPNVDLLAEHLDLTLPGDVLAETPAAPPVSSAATASHDAVTSLSNGSLEEVIAAQQRTIASLVTLLEKGGAAPTSRPAEKVPARAATAASPVEVETTIPQRGIYASSRLSERLSASYNESMTLRFTGTIAIEKMTRAMDRLVERHDALHASFDEAGLMMRIAPTLKIALPVTDLSSTKELGRQEELLRKLIADETARPFRLPEGPLFRCQMVLLARDRAAVIFTAHHIVCDGWSLDVMIHDLCAFYSEEISGTPARLAPANRYVDYVESVTRRHRSQAFKAAGAYWHAQFKDGLPALVLPTDHPRSARREFKARRLDHAVPALAVQNLKALGARESCSLFAVLLSAYAILLARVSRQRRYVIALPTAEQPVIGQPGLVGHCVNLLPFAVELRDSETVSAFLERVHGELLAAHDHAEFTMSSLLEDLHPIAPGLGISSISAGLTNVKKFKPHELPQLGFTVDYDANPKSYESFELYLNAVEKDDDVELRCHYDIKLFEDITVREWLATLDSIFEDIAADPSRQVLDLARLNRAKGDSSSSLVQIAGRGSADENLLTGASSTAERLFSDSSTATSTLTETALVHALLQFWKRVLQVDEVGSEDDFFALGGHSIAAAQLTSLIERELGLVAPLATLYEASTPRMLARFLCQGRAGGSWQRQQIAQHSADRRPLARAQEAQGSGLLCQCSADIVAVAEAGSATPLSTTNNDFGVSRFVEEDLSEAANLWWAQHRCRQGAAPPKVVSYFHELYFARQPWTDRATPSLVYRDKSGKIVGFLGVIRRKMLLQGKPIRVNFGGNFIVHPEARSTPAGLQLLGTYMAGDQDLSLTDSANDASRTIMERLGFSTIAPYSVHWARPLRPAHYAAHVFCSLSRPAFSAGLKIATKPICSAVDGLAKRLSFNPFCQPESPLQAEELDVDTHLQCLADFGNGYSLLPEYDARSLESLLTFMETMHSGLDLRKFVLRDDKHKILGWYIYYVKPGTVGQVVQIGGRREFIKDVLDHLFWDAGKQGAIALHGVVPSDLMPEYWEKHCFFTCQNGWTLAHSRDPELLDVLNRGDAFLSRLDGEWCLGFEE